MHRTLSRILAALTMTLAASVAVAATDGTLGITSTGTSVITVTTGEAIQITNLNDITQPWAGIGFDVEGTDDVCVYTNAVSATYQVTINSTYPGGLTGFQLYNGTAFLAYQVGWTNATGSTFAGSTCMGAGLPCGQGLQSVVQTGPSAVLNCGGATNATVSIFVAEADIIAAGAATWTDTLSILVEPV